MKVVQLGARAHKTSSAILPVHAGERLISVNRQWNARNRVWVVSSRRGEWLLMSQSLSQLVQCINEDLGTNPCERVSKTGLFDASVSAKLHKYNWLVSEAPLSLAIECFEEARRVQDFQAVALVGNASCYNIMVGNGS